MSSFENILYKSLEYLTRRSPLFGPTEYVHTDKFFLPSKQAQMMESNT